MQAETWFERFNRQREARYRQERIERASWRKLAETEGEDAQRKEGEGVSATGEGTV